MDRFNQALRRSATIRMAARGVIFVVLAGTLVGIAAYIQAQIPAYSFLATTAVLTLLLILEASLFMIVKRIFRNIA